MPAQYLKSAKSNAVCPITKMLLMNAKTVDNITPIWAHVFSKYFDTSESYVYFHMTEHVPRVPGRKFPAVTYVDRQSHDAPNRRVMLVEAMDLQGATWDAKTSDIFSVLRGLDSTHGTRKVLGVLSAGKHFVLFEVSGAQEPKYLIGSPQAPADLLDEATSLGFEKQINGIKAAAKAGNCKAFIPHPDSATVVTGRSGRATPSRPGSPAPASRSRTPPASRSSSQVSVNGTVPAARVSSPTPRAASPVRVAAVATTKSAATRRK